MKYFINPDEFETTNEIRAFDTVELRDEYAPEYSTEIDVLPDDYHPDKYRYTGKNWVVKSDWFEGPRFTPAELRLSELQNATAQARHYFMMNDKSKLSIWQRYYQAVYKLADDPKWPDEVTWPTKPVDSKEK